MCDLTDCITYDDYVDKMKDILNLEMIQKKCDDYLKRTGSTIKDYELTSDGKILLFQYLIANWYKNK
jgi:hypothetical protein